MTTQQNTMPMRRGGRVFDTPDWLSPLLQQMQAQEDSAAAEAAQQATLRNNGAPAVGPYGQGYAQVLTSRAAQGPFSALDAAALFNHSNAEARAMAEAAAAQRELQLRISDDNNRNRRLIAAYPQLESIFRTGVKVDGLETDPVVNTAWRTQDYAGRNADIRNTTAETIGRLTDAGLPPEQETAETWLRDVNQAPDSYEVTDSGEMVPKWARTLFSTPNRYSPDNMASVETANINADATKTAAAIRAANKEDNQPQVTVHVSPSGLLTGTDIKGAPSQVSPWLTQPGQAMNNPSATFQQPTPVQPIQMQGPRAAQALSMAVRANKLPPDRNNSNTRVMMVPGNPNPVFVDVATGFIIPTQ